MDYATAYLPSYLPTWPQLLDSLGHPAPADLARFLGVTERTVFNYARRGEAPRAVVLALFWITNWGASHVDTHRENCIRAATNLTVLLKKENENLRARIARLEALGDFGAANLPAQSTTAQAAPPARRYEDQYGAPAQPPAAPKRRRWG